MTRMVVFFVLPILAAAMWRSRRRLVMAAAIPLALWMVLPGVASADHIGDPAAEAELPRSGDRSWSTQAGGQPGRVEVPFTAGHWEVAYIAVGGADRPRVGAPGRHGSQRDALRRGTHRRASIASGSTSTPCAGSRCPTSNSTRVASAEAALLERGVPWLRLVRTTEHWRIWEVVDATPIVDRSGPARERDRPTRS